MKKYGAILALIFLLFFLVKIPTAPGKNGALLSFYVSQFRFNSDSTLVELNYGLLPESEQKSKIFVLELDVTQRDSTVLQNLWKVRPPQPNPKNQMLVDVIRFLLPPGRYNLKLLTKAVGAGAQMDSAFVRGVTIRRFPATQTGLSDPVLARKIEPAQGSGRFVKNGFRVVPNPLGIFDTLNPTLYYYVEVYNLPQTGSKFYFLKREVTTANGASVPAFPAYEKKKRIRGRDDLEVGLLPVSNLKTGRYRLRFSVLDSSKNELAKSQVDFVVHNPQLPAQGRPQMEKSLIARLSPQKVDLFVGATRYFLPQEEQKIVSGLSDETAKRRFLFQFWNGKGGKSGLRIFRAFVQRVEYANANFSESKQAGWQTDRGRIFILYGKPSEIQYYANLPGFREFQAWSYENIEHGVVFIFGVTGSFGNFKLLHSTKTGEIHNEAWLDLLKVTAGRTGLTEMAPGISQREAIRAMFRRYNLEIPRFLLK